MINILLNLWTKTEIQLGIVFSIIWTVVSEMVGGFDEQFTALFVLVILDLMSGVWAACKTHTFQSAIASRGLFKKGTMFLIIFLGVLLDSALHIHMVRTMFIGAFAIIEAMSLVENTDRLGYGQYIPSFVRKWLAQIADEKKVGEDIEKSN